MFRDISRTKLHTIRLYLMDEAYHTAKSSMCEDCFVLFFLFYFGAVDEKRGRKRKPDGWMY